MTGLSASSSTAHKHAAHLQGVGSGAAFIGARMVREGAVEAGCGKIAGMEGWGLWQEVLLSLV